MWSSIAFDYVARQKFAGNSMTYFIVKQLPVLPPGLFEEALPWAVTSTIGGWIESRAGPRTELYRVGHAAFRAGSGLRRSAVCVG